MPAPAPMPTPLTPPAPPRRARLIRARLRLAGLDLAGLGLASLLAGGAPALADGPARPAAPAPVALLKHLPAGPGELVFRGEAARRSWSVFVGRGEIERIRSLQLGLKSALALLPDRSSLRVAINGRVLATVPARSPDETALVTIPVPPGLLVPGYNRIEVAATMAHRVDCSVAATYELWARLDPAKTGLVLSAPPAVGVRNLDDVGAEPLAADGTSRIALRGVDVGDAAAVARAGRFVAALVARAGLARPVVEVAREGGAGPGLDVMVVSGTRDVAQGLRVLGRDEGVTLARDANTGRLVLLLAGADDADLDRQIDGLGARASRAAAPGPAGQVLAEGATRRSFAEIGLPTDAFAGRRYTATLDVVLPGDFYPANYDRARLMIDGAAAPGLDPDSTLVFRVNGALVSSLRLDGERGGTLSHEMVELPLRFFRPGHNEVALEALTATAADAGCDTAAAGRGARFTLAGSSEIEIPRFAHLGTMPQIPGALAARGPTELYLASADAAAVGAGLTVLAGMAVGRQPDAPVRVHLGAPAPGDAPGIVVGAFGALPPDLAAEVRADTRAAAAGTMGVAGVAGAADAGTGGAEPQPRAFDLRALAAQGGHFLKTQGFFFADDGGAGALPVTPRSLVVAAAAPHPAAHEPAGLDLPRFTRDGAQWLVVAAADTATLGDGVARLVSDGHWADLRGRATSLDADTGEVASVAPSRVVYVVPDRVVLSDVRPILGGILSNNIRLSLAVLMAAMALLGLSTHALVRRMGAKR